VVYFVVDRPGTGRTRGRGNHEHRYAETPEQGAAGVFAGGHPDDHPGGFLVVGRGNAAGPVRLDKMTKHIPAGYIGTTQDVVGVVNFLLTEEARYVTGTNIQVSGGWGI